MRISGRCTITGGTWRSAYDGQTATSPKQLDMDHLVPLQEAYRSGADRWTPEQRANYANDPLVLIPVSKKSNRSKGDRDPAGWRPSDHSSWCSNATRWIKIKERYDLSADEREETALGDMSNTCQ